ncbi:AHH domain-containing protein [Bacillus wiedmannii]|uniref:AHH domain-containing protein n=1 Tax=Bacillus wiedmannii TaxID=1890302 RepID=UPI00399C97E1
MIKGIWIDHDSTANGVFLPYKVNEYVTTEVLHIGNHSSEYILEVERVLSLVKKRDGTQEDAIDYEKAILKKLRSGLVIDFKKYAFLPNIVKNQTIFKVYLNEILHIPSIFVSDEFRNTVLESDLKGFEFIEVWDSEANM